MNAQCDWHITQKFSGSIQYIAGIADADRRHKAGQRQRQCPECNKWVWPDLFGERPEWGNLADDGPLTLPSRGG